MHDDYEKIYLKNQNLVYKFATNYKLLNDEDMMQNLRMAMFRAIKNFDPSKGFALSTYVYIALYHEYKYSFRDKNLKIEYASNIVDDENGKQFDIFDFVEDTRNIDNIEYINKKEIFKIINDYINNCEKDYRDLFYDYYFNNVKQKELAKRYNLSQGQVSRKIKSIIKCLQELLKDYK